MNKQEIDEKLQKIIDSDCYTGTFKYLACLMREINNRIDDNPCHKQEKPVRYFRVEFEEEHELLYFLGGNQSLHIDDVDMLTPEVQATYEAWIRQGGKISG